MHTDTQLVNRLHVLLHVEHTVVFFWLPKRGMFGGDSAQTAASLGGLHKSSELERLE